MYRLQYERERRVGADSSRFLWSSWYSWWDCRHQLYGASPFLSPHSRLSVAESDTLKECKVHLHSPSTLEEQVQQ